MSECVQCDGTGAYFVLGLKLSCVCRGSASSAGTKSPSVSKPFPPNEEDRKRLKRKSLMCLAIAVGQLGEGAPDSKIEDKAVVLMDKTERELGQLQMGL